MGKRLSEVLLEGQIAHPTLKKYVGMGLLPRPQIVRGGSRGSASVYPDSVVGLIHTIETLKAQGHTLDDIRGLLSAQKEVRREVLAVKPNPHRFTRVLDVLPDWAFYIILAILIMTPIAFLWTMSDWTLCNCDDSQLCRAVLEAEPTTCVEGEETAICLPVLHDHTQEGGRNGRPFVAPYRL